MALFDVLTQDLRYAARGLKSAPGFTLGVVATLALGLGANAAVFGVLDHRKPIRFVLDVGELEDHPTLGGRGPNFRDAHRRFRDALLARG